MKYADVVSRHTCVCIIVLCEVLNVALASNRLHSQRALRWWHDIDCVTAIAY